MAEAADSAEESGDAAVEIEMDSCCGGRLMTHKCRGSQQSSRVV